MHRASIQSKLDVMNANSFQSNSLQIVLLKDCPHLIPILARWLYDEWHPFDQTLKEEKIIQSLQNRMNDQQIPIGFIVLKKDDPVAMICLKHPAEKEFSDFPQEGLWMSSLQVHPGARGCGLGEKLVKLALVMGNLFGFEELNFYTSCPIRARWYQKMGAEVIEKRAFRGHTITIFKLYCPLAK